MQLNVRGIFGPAGSGKSYNLKQELERDHKFAKLTATTGVAAMNLGSDVATVHSTLGFHDLESLRMNKDRIVNNFIRTAYSYKGLVIDEISMFNAEALDIIFDCYVKALDEMEYIRKRPSNFQLIVAGDFLQLPPVQGKFAFHAECWKYFAPYIEKLTKIYRQRDPQLAEALQMAREGKGISTARALASCGVSFISEPRIGFRGVTLMAVNNSVDKFNLESYALLDGEEYECPSTKWGRQLSDWKMIPDVLKLKLGSQVMALANRRESVDEHGEKLVYANGSVGILTDIEPETGLFVVKFDKSGREGAVRYIDREYTAKVCPVGIPKLEYKGMNPPESIDSSDSVEEAMNKRRRWAKFFDEWEAYVIEAKTDNKAYFDPVESRWTLGTISYVPLQLAYALSFHKAQGLSLDSVQIDARSKWAGNPGMMYVALSRATDPKGITIVGNPTQVAKRILTSPEVKAWI